MFEKITKLPESVKIVCENSEKTFAGASQIGDGDIKIGCENGVLTLTADKTPVKTVIFSWDVEFPRECIYCGDHFERGYGDLEFKAMNHGRIFPWYFICKCAENTAFYGVKTLPDSVCHFKITPHKIYLYCDTRVACDGVVLSGRTITLAQVVCDEFVGLSAYETGIQACKAMVTKAVFPEKTVYGFNNWYYAYGTSTAEEILENSAHLAHLTKGLENRPYMIIDDCWQKFRRSEDGFIGGPWREGNRYFPDMKKLAQDISDMGNLPGIWIRPLQNKADDLTDEMYFDKSDYILDPSRQDVLDYIAGDVRTITDWGYRLIKHDYSTNDITGAWGFEMSDGFAAKGKSFSDRSRTTAEVIKRLYKTIHDAANGKALILGCNTIGHLGTGYFEINRTGDDTSGNEFERTRKMGVNTLAFRMCQNNVFYKADADCVGIMAEMDHEKNRQWLRLLAKSGTPLFVSVSPTLLGQEDNRLLGEMLKIASQEHPSAVPSALEYDVCPETWTFYDAEESFEW